jgi:hypothetical protein
VRSIARVWNKDRELNKWFTATMQKSQNLGGWTYVVMPESAQFFGTRGLVKALRFAVQWTASPLKAPLWQWATAPINCR